MDMSSALQAPACHYCGKAAIKSDWDKATKKSIFVCVACLAVPTFRHEGPRVGRNQPCPCGSGRKFKACCLHPQPSPKEEPKMEAREPKAGDTFFPVFESDITEAKANGVDLKPYTITDVEHKWDPDETGVRGDGWTVAACPVDNPEDVVGYDCQWSETHGCWCYGI